ncbi:MAG: ATP-binding cassette domain-containing protein [Deltaproteobacteria bacterium]|nr:ATP-binding cassette domain-containing protein [Deltaproteobacteria bacterium]
MEGHSSIQEILPDGENRAKERLSDGVILEVRNLKKHFSLTSAMILRTVIGEIKAVDGVSFSIRRGETLGLVGESGCGKTTTGRCILQLERPTSGEVIFEGKDLTRMEGAALRAIRPRMQIIFQDPFSSLNPRMNIGQIIGEGPKVFKLVANRQKLRERVAYLLSTVGLNPSLSSRYPHELSGGQRQRVGIARALAMEANLIICDEPVSALDVSIQAQIINLLEELQEKFGLTYLFIAHDLSVVRHISHWVAVMYFGKIVEITGRNELYEKPIHPYTRALLSAVPIPDPVVEASRAPIILKGEVPSPLNPPSGCVFHPRCNDAWEECGREVPELKAVEPNHWVSCLRV